ncbi:MAG: KTSC domain-containing protein [Nostoc sp.]
MFFSLPVISSMAMNVGYDRDEHILQVEFQSGAVYQYLGLFYLRFSFHVAPSEEQLNIHQQRFVQRQ